MEGHPARPHVAIHSVGAAGQEKQCDHHAREPAAGGDSSLTSHGKRPRQGPFVRTILWGAPQLA